VSGSDPETQRALGRFYLDLIWELESFIRQPRATPVGVGVVVKRVAIAHGVEVAQNYPLPRLTRAEERERRSG
jgi:hypothetical protein